MCVCVCGARLETLLLVPSLIIRAREQWCVLESRRKFTELTQSLVEGNSTQLPKRRRKECKGERQLESCEEARSAEEEPRRHSQLKIS